MSEIEKMYRKVGLASHSCKYPRFCDDNNCNECPNYSSEFTAEKQIAILITLVNYNLYEEDKKLMIDSFNGEIYIGFYQDTTLMANATDKEFSECVAKLINNLWQDLTESERNEIKEILQ